MYAEGSRRTRIYSCRAAELKLPQEHLVKALDMEAAFEAKARTAWIYDHPEVDRLWVIERNIRLH